MKMLQFNEFDDFEKLFEDSNSNHAENFVSRTTTRIEQENKSLISYDYHERGTKAEKTSTHTRMWWKSISVAKSFCLLLLEAGNNKNSDFSCVPKESQKFLADASQTHYIFRQQQQRKTTMKKSPKSSKRNKRLSPSVGCFAKRSETTDDRRHTVEKWQIAWISSIFLDISEIWNLRRKI